MALLDTSWPKLDQAKTDLEKDRLTNESFLRTETS